MNYTNKPKQNSPNRIDFLSFLSSNRVMRERERTATCDARKREDGDVRPARKRDESCDLRLCEEERGDGITVVSGEVRNDGQRSGAALFALLT